MAGIETKLHARSNSDLGNVRTRAIRPTGTMSAPPHPCTTRLATSIGMFNAIPHRSEPAVNNPMAVKKTRRVPNRSAIQPLIGMKTARLSM